MGPWCIVNMMLILQVLSIDAHELEWVCNHLGHTTKIHKLHYRATSGLIERIEISKLMLIQENNLVRNMLDESCRTFSLKASPINFSRTWHFSNTINIAILQPFDQHVQAFVHSSAMMGDDVWVFEMKRS